MWTDLTFEKPVFAAVSLKVDPDDNTKLKGEVDFIASSMLSAYGDDNDYSAWTDAASSAGPWSEYPFKFNSIHSDITNNVPGAGGTAVSNLSNAINIFELQIWPKALTFGSTSFEFS